MRSDTRCPVVLDPVGTDIHAEGARIRANGPVSQVELPGGVRAWSVTGYEVAQQILGDQRFSKNGRLHWTEFAEGRVGDDFPLIGWILMDNLTTAYGKDHSRLRRPCPSAFTPRRVEALRPSVEKVTQELLDALDATAPGEVVDLKALFAHPLPAAVICDLFGVPAEDRLAMLHGGEVNVDTSITPEEAAANVAAWHQLMLDFVQQKRENPGSDLTTDLVLAEDEDGNPALSDSEMVGTLHIMLATGTEPVKNLIANTVLLLLTHPEYLQRVKDGELTWPEVVQESVRVEAPVAHLPFRFAVEDVQIGDVTIPKGEPVLMNYAALGRDPERYPDPDVFDPFRADKEHLSFGAGIYRCIGRPLALMEAEIALSSLFERFPGLRLAVPREEIESQQTFIMNGVDTRPVVIR